MAAVAATLCTRDRALVRHVEFAVADSAIATLEDVDLAAFTEMVVGNVGPIALVDGGLPAVRNVGDERFELEPRDAGDGDRALAIHIHVEHPIVVTQRSVLVLLEE